MGECEKPSVRGGVGRAGECEQGIECDTHTHRRGVTHQELAQVFVVGDDAVVDDDELWRQRRGPAQPHGGPWPGSGRHVTQTAETTKLCGAKSRARQRKEERASASPPAATALCRPPQLAAAGDNDDPGGTRATEILEVL